MSSTLQGVPVDPTPPASGEGLIFNGSVYVPTPANPGDITAVNTTLPLTGGGVSGALTLDINNFTGDSGAGGLDGAVPAPAAGDAAAGKFLKSDGTWAVPGGGGVSTLANMNDNGSVFPVSGVETDILNTGAIVTAAGKSQFVMLDASINISDDATGDIQIRIYADGVQINGTAVRKYATGVKHVWHVGMSALSTGLAAGAHTFKATIYFAIGTLVYTNAFSSSATPTKMKVLEF